MCLYTCLTYLYKASQSSRVLKLHVQILFIAQNAKTNSDQAHMTTPAYYHIQSLKKYLTKAICCSVLLSAQLVKHSQSLTLINF